MKGNFIFGKSVLMMRTDEVKASLTMADVLKFEADLQEDKKSIRVMWVYFKDGHVSGIWKDCITI